ncbi:transcriptional regulator, TetR family [Streptomyces sp. LamerLS-316]|uniref:TetR/AcrR family transcriptional regulator n=1 Tax=unclassified Streptomyces TaxID=2593676 RepID=UPI000823BBF7|nr:MULTISPECIES: TetR-like C-terminal domain-containing protein [unclassified Streptomyces]MYQ41129.1 TetR family transcriptional regulator [Streptomyces sp. SID4921]SCK08056.1 transcriptional regulator, TetR family [Streptomyces sp. LamerLS-316]
MPTPEKTSLSGIVAAGRELLEAGGQQGLTMQGVAQRVGVRAPSLYKHVDNRAALLAAVAEATVDDLGSRLAATDGSLEELARCYRRFAGARPEGFRLTHSTYAPPRSLALAARPVLRAARELVGERDALDGARLLTAWLTGFIEMELNGAFRLGGDVDRAFEYGLRGMRRALTDGHQAPPA